jgi:hypothetical protein
MQDASLRDVDRVLDAVAVDDAGEPIAIASCKWTEGAMRLTELDRLTALAAHLRPDGDSPALFLFSRSGFERPLQEAAAERGSSVRLVGIDEL